MQRDILPIVEGTTVNTKCGMVRTDHILFIAAGAFHVSKPSDLIPSCRAASRSASSSTRSGVTSSSNPHRASQRPRQAVHRPDGHGGIAIRFTDDAIERIADFATIVNDRTENIGARRLHTVMEKLLDEISFEGRTWSRKDITIDAAYVDKMLAEIVKNEDLSRYIL